MLTSITPLGERGRNRNWIATTTVYSFASIAAGGVAGSLFGLVGSLIPGGWRAGWPSLVAALAIGIAALDELGAIAVTPIGKRQVNEDWLDEYRGWVVGAGFGFQLGLGLVTIVTTLLLPVTMLLALLTFSPQAGAWIGAAFGLARAVPLWQARRITEPERLAAMHRSHDASAKSVRVAVGLAAVPIALVVLL